MVTTCRSISPATSSLAIRRNPFPRVRVSERSPGNCPCSPSSPPPPYNDGNDLGHLISRSLPRARRPSSDCEGGLRARRAGASSAQMTVISLPCGFVHRGLIIVHFRRVNNGLRQTSLNGASTPLRAVGPDGGASVPAHASHSYLRKGGV